jgi:hypothetical protein
MPSYSKPQAEATDSLGHDLASNNLHQALLAFYRRAEDHLWSLIDEGCRTLPVIVPEMQACDPDKPFMLSIVPRITHYKVVSAEDIAAARAKRRATYGDHTA